MSETTFEQLNLENPLLKSLENIEFTTPTPIQENVIPHLKKSEDIIALAETGSGKTAAFIIPLINQILKDEDRTTKEIKYIVLSPTRELAQQTHEVCKSIGKSLDITSSLLIGGENIQKQKESISKKPHFLIATPGRLKDLFQKKILNFKTVKGVVLDEADRLLDMGFKDEICFLLYQTPKERQLMMFSATGNHELSSIAYRFNAEPKQINLLSTNLVVDKIQHTVAQVGDNEKMPLLTYILKENTEAYAIIFCNTKSETHVVATWLKKLNFPAEGISGDLAQNKRTKLLSDFRSKKTKILVCTDVAARGLDIKDVNLVINYDLPQDPSNYIHRIGRTGRAGTEGRAISFCGFYDCEYLDAIENVLKESITKETLTNEMFIFDIGERPSLERKPGKIIDLEKSRKKKDNTRKSPENRKMGKRNSAQEKRKETNLQSIESKKRQVNATKLKDSKTMMNKDRDMKSKKAFSQRKLVITSTSLKDAESKAMHHFKIKNQSFLDNTILEKGRRKYFGLIGPRKVKYEFKIKPLYKEIISEYLKGFFAKSPFNVDFEVSKEGKKLIGKITGEDEALFSANDGELLSSLEYLLRKHLSKLINLEKAFTIQINTSDFINSHERRLEVLAQKLRDKAVKRKNSVITDTMSPSDRYIVHQFLNSDPRVSTSSIGKGHYKRVRINFEK